MTHVTSAIIVGGGIGGAATALSLARQGIKVMLLEKRTKLARLARVFSLGRTLFRRWIVSVWAMLPASVRCLPITLP